MGSVGIAADKFPLKCFLKKAHLVQIIDSQEAFGRFCSKNIRSRLESTAIGMGNILESGIRGQRQDGSFLRIET